MATTTDTPTAVCVGETMIVLVPDQPGPLEDARVFHSAVGGAESNVACGLAALGVPAAWLSRLGDDGFGRRIRAEIDRYGVDVSAVVVDPKRPTGLYVKEIGTGSSRPHYYRAGSAASAIGADVFDDPRAAKLLGDAKLIHLTGITAALGYMHGERGGIRLVEEIFRRRRPDQVVSFDVNWRPSLWPDQDPAIVARLAGHADVVLVGSDEAEHVFGTADPARLRELLPDPGTLVVKDGEHAVVAIDGEGSHVERALSVEVVEPVGAGDAFAAGYLSGLLRGYDQRRRLRLGHLCAAMALVTHGDVGTAPPPEVIAELLDCDDDEWAAIRADRDGFHRPG